MSVCYVCQHFTIFTGIYSDPVAFLASKLLIMLFTWSTVAALVSSSAVAGNSFSYFLLFFISQEVFSRRPFQIPIFIPQSICNGFS